jgi:SAM-dependent methyltransferase
MPGLRDTGAYGLLRTAKARFQRTINERGLVDTGVEVSAEELGDTNPDHVPYTASAWSWTRRALNGRAVTGDDVFLDLGCGKGRVLWLAARDYPFGRVVGVERSEELAATARGNLEANRARLQARDVVVDVADAVAYDVPDDVTFAYMFNPFEGDVFRRALANLIASLDRRPRKVTLIYANPTMAAAVAESGRFELVDVIKPRLRRDIGETGWINVYESVAGRVPGGTAA